MKESLKILFLEDNPNDFELNKYELKNGGISFTSEWAQNKNEFEKALHSFQPDLILSDYSIPGFDGLTAFKILRNSGKDIPFILVTGEVSEAFAVESMKSGIDDYILKAGLHRLPLAIEQVLQKRETEKKIKLAESLVKESAEKWEATFNGIKDSIFLLDVNSVILKANKVSYKIFDKKEGEIVGRHCYEVVHNTCEPINGCPYSKMKLSKIRESMLLPVNDKWFEVVVDPLFGEDGILTGAIHVVSDITERKNVEDALHDSETRLKRAHKVAKMGSWEWDLITNDLYWAEDNYYIHGIDTRVKPSYQEFLNVVDPAEHEFINNAVSKTIAGESTYDIDYTIIRPDNGEKCIINSRAEIIRDSSGKALKMVGTVQDITERKKAEIALLQSETNLRAIFENTTTGFLLLDTQFNILSSNDRAMELTALAFGSEGAKGNNLLAMVPAHRKQIFADYQAKVLQGENIHYEVPYRQDNRDDLWLEISSKPVVNQTSTIVGISFAINDISERKLAEQMLHEKELQFRELYNETPVMMHSVNQKGVLWSVSDYWMKKLGYSRAEVIGRNFTDFLTGESRKYALEKIFPQFMSTGHVENIEYDFVKKNGEIINCFLSAISQRDHRNRFIRSLAVITDITDRKKAEVELIKIHKAIYSSSESIFITNMDGVITYANPGFTSTYGYSSEEIIGKATPRILKSGKSSHEAYQWFWKTLMSGQEVKGELINKKKDGTLIDVDSTSNPIFNEKKDIIGFLCIQHDITGRKKAENELRNAHDNIQLLLDSIAEGAYGVDTDGRCTFVNKSFLRMMGYDDASEFIGKQIHPIIHHSHEDGSPYPASECKMLNTRIVKESITVSDEVFWRKDGSPLPVEYWSYPIIQNEKIVGAICTFIDITERKWVEKFQKLSTEILTILNSDLSLKEMAGNVLDAIKRETKYSAVGFRLKDGDDYPYFEEKGFSKGFMRFENTLMVKDKNNNVCTDENGNPKLECTCGMVLTEKIEHTNPFLTKAGSFYTNDSEPLLQLTPEQEPRFHPRNTCIHLGYGSVAIIPIRAKGITVGTLQLNDKKKDAFTSDTISFFEGICLSIGTALMRKQGEEEIIKLNAGLEQKVEERTHEINVQKKIIEDKNKDLTDSIVYAQHLQKALYTDRRILENEFPHSFILNQPCNIVSGDFCWFAKKPEMFIITCVDCTGHGVPGAFMSIIGSELMSKIIVDRNTEKPSEILEQMDEELEKILMQKDANKVNDGMDVSVCVIYPEKQLIEFAGANHPIILVSEGKSVIYRGNRFGIGKYIDASSKSFETRTIHYKKGDLLYMFSDGYRDQFGEKSKKKLRLAPFALLVEEIAQLPVENQKEEFEQRFSDWKGANDQVDDLMLVGIQL